MAMFRLKLISSGIFMNDYRRNNVKFIREQSNRKSYPKMKKKTTLESIMASIEAKGFLRNTIHSYNPPADVSQEINLACKREGVDNLNTTKIESLTIKYNLLSDCARKFNYAIPNSKLNEIETIGDLKIFYEKEVKNTVPIEKFNSSNLPSNLIVYQNYHRFKPSNGKLFVTKTAFPQNATLVSGLKYKKKYAENRIEKPWPEKIYSLFDS